MAVDFSNDIRTTERQMARFVRKGQKVPKDVLAHYTNLLSGTINAQTVENGQADDFPAGDLAGIFPSVSTTSSVVIAASTSREFILIQNIGTETIYINFNGPAGVAAGLQLVAGGSWSSQFPQFAKAEIHAIAETGSSTLALYTIG